ncbi:unnamed protein product [Spodoptera littoralis]|uniref:Gustatory receptor n=1 Tax=Spodoptera littoralis TaxID=7109 RepID=A0A9P0NAM2_SPOLI|nr:unnamed protein product [Spodoptera littoralis]CAH1645881.1 unnamed protein product [Spodoptera littoralis]
MWRCTLVHESFMLFIAIMTIVDLSKTLISLMVEAQQRCGTSDVITGETVKGWVELYQELVNCCDKVAVCFGCQYIFSLTCTIVHYVNVVYNFIYFNVFKTLEFDDNFKLWFLMIGYVMIMSLPIVATQMASNQWVRCQRVIARLHNNMIDDVNTAERKMIKDFIRVIKKHPLQIRFMSKVPVGIFLLPAILTAVVNHVIILLQFNHVV